MGGEGREGDWECNSCKNRNYAFRSFCNRCKQPRLLVDTKTPADSKWLPRIGDWICTGCTNNNYASREKCKKCGQPREVAAMPAIAMPGVSLPTYYRYFARAQGMLDPIMNIGYIGNSAALQQPLPPNPRWSVVGADKHGVQPVFSWPMGGPHNSGLPYANLPNQSLAVSKGWRNGDWLCNCGFHNYSSRAQCKKCNALPQAVGSKRLASDEFVQDLDHKRLNVGHTNGHQQSYKGFEPLVDIADLKNGPYTLFPNASSVMAPMPLLQPKQAVAPTIVGKGAKQWRDGDWMCKNCNNHNYASRTNCNRCKTQREDAVEVEQPVNVI